MIFGIKGTFIILNDTICCWYKYARATYDWFCGAGSHILKFLKGMVQQKKFCHFLLNLMSLQTGMTFFIL